MGAEVSIQQHVRNFVVRKFPAAKKRAISDDAPLLESGIIDSLGTLDVVTFLEQSFGIAIADEELTPENFSSIGALTAFVAKKTGLMRVPLG